MPRAWETQALPRWKWNELKLVSPQGGETIAERFRRGPRAARYGRRFRRLTGKKGRHEAAQVWLEYQVHEKPDAP